MRGEHIPLRQTHGDVYRAALKLAGLEHGERFLEIGSGEGTGLVIAANEFGANVVGVELRPDVAERARKLAKRAKAKVEVVQASILDHDVSSADVVYSYMGPAFQDELADQLTASLSPTARVVTIDFSMPGWKCVAETAHDETNCFLYTPNAPWCAASIDHAAQTVLMSSDDPMDVFTVIQATFHRDFDRIEVVLDEQLRGVVEPHHRAGGVSRGVTVPFDMEITHQSRIPATGLSGFATIVGHAGIERVLCARQRWIVLPFDNQAGEDALMTLPGDLDLGAKMLALFERVVAGDIDADVVATAFRRAAN